MRKTRKGNYPTQKVADLPSEFVTETVSTLAEIRQIATEQGAITNDPSDDGKFRDRVNLFIEYCSANALRPGIETLCLFLGISRQTLYRWKNGGISCSTQRRSDLNTVTQLIFTYLEQAGMGGKLNPVSYVWLSKNWMSYTDSNTEFPVDASRGAYDPQEIASRYADAELPQKPEML